MLYVKTPAAKFPAAVLLICAVMILSSCSFLKSGHDDDEISVISSSDGGFTAPISANTEYQDTKTDEPSVSDPVTIEPPQLTEPIEIGKNLSVSGIIDPNKDELLKLHIEWSAVQTSDTATAKLTVAVYLDSYAIYVSGRKNCKLIINGESAEFSTELISYEGNSRNSVEIFRKEVEILNPADRPVIVDVSAAYYFGGTYGGEAVNWIESSGSILLEQEAGTVNNPLIPDLPDNTAGY